jgi:DNA-binding GntR family transcriptional regulator
MGYIVSLITAQDVREIYEMRAILETAAVRLAAARAPDEWLRALAKQATFTYTYKDRESYIEFLNRNADFHRSIAAAAGNARLTELISRALDELNRVFHLGLDLRDSAQEMTNDHIAVAGALCARDAARAAELVQAEIERSRERVLQALKKYHDLPLSAERRLALHFLNKK